MSTPAVQMTDSVRQARIVDAVHAMSDSLAAVRGAAAAFRADLARVSRDLVLERAEHVRTRCAAAGTTALTLDDALAAGPYVPRARAAQARVRAELVALRRALARCVTEHTAAPRPQGLHEGRVADSVRAWGPYRLALLERDIRRFESAVFALKQQAGFR